MKSAIVAVLFIALSLQMQDVSSDEVKVSDSDPSNASPTTATTTFNPTTKQTTEGTTLNPTAGNTTVNPTTGIATTKATAGNTTMKPTTEIATTKPTAGNTTMKPTTKITTMKPTVGNTTMKPTTGVTTMKPTAGNITMKPTTGNTTMRPTAGNTTLKPTAGNTTMKPTTGLPHINTTVEPKTTLIPPTDLDFVVKSKGKKCLFFKGVVSINVTMNANVKTYDLKNDGVEVSGKCSSMKSSNETAAIYMNWKDGTLVAITFRGGDVWFMSALEVTVKDNEQVLSGTAEYKIGDNGKLFEAKNNHTYTCQKEEVLMLKSEGKGYNITVDFKSVEVQPFAADNGKSFINKMVCPSKTNPNPNSSIVPIAVGCALAGLIVIVLIAYLIGRRKGGNRGYQKV